MLKKKAFAKINLFLQAVGKQSNYTQINTVFAEIDLFDELTFELHRSEKIEFFCDIAALNDQSNLVFRIADFIKKVYAVEQGAKISLYKNIPTSAGLGGGSSDAATTIDALSYLWNLNIPKKRKEQIANQFGSDITFFLYGGTCKGSGTGTLVEPINFPTIENILLVKPPIEISSGYAYSLIKEYHASENWSRFLAEKDIQLCFNDLEKGICKRFNIVQQTIDELKEFGPKSIVLSGSGPTVIGFFETNEDLKLAKKFFENRNFWVYKTKTKRRNNEHYKS